MTDYLYIVLADDDEDDRLLFTEAFEELKIDTRVDTFKDGVELMNYLNKEDSILPSILFLDLNMPKKSGIECLKEIKQKEKI
jgi:CheY-like chemotaxis protein